LRAAPAALCEIYTTFSAETFASGGSSIGTLRALTVASFVIYELDGLHAKIILVSGHSVSIGSQNLTRGGTVNKEATVFLTEPAEVARVEKALAPWIASRKLITPEMIADMESRLPKLRRLFRKFRSDSLATNTAVRVGEHARQERLQELQKHLAAIPTAKAAVVARVTRIDQAVHSFHGPYNSNTSLLAKQEDN
jgi:phosphatidylserine/phosphatidylglycerophosphate/cardiolipin synthase-like enzyme